MREGERIMRGKERIQENEGKGTGKEKVVDWRRRRGGMSQKRKRESKEGRKWNLTTGWEQEREKRGKERKEREQNSEGIVIK